MHEAERGDTVRRIAREGDPDRGLAVLFAPPDARPDLFALYAFNVELARIAEQVSEPDLGAIRLQWWREAIERATRGEPAGHPVADAVGSMIRDRALPAERVAALIDARAFDVATSALFALAAECLGAREPSLARAAAASGMAYGLTGLMRALPVHAREGRVYLPADALIRHGTSPERILAGETSEDLLAVLAELRGKARGALAEAQRHVAELDAGSRRAFLPLCLVDPYLAALEKSGRDPLREIADINPLYRLWRMARWH